MLMSHCKMWLLMTTYIRGLVHLLKTCRMPITWLLNIAFCHSIITRRRNIQLPILHLLTVIKLTTIRTHTRPRRPWRMISRWHWQIVNTVPTIHITTYTITKLTGCRISFNWRILRPPTIPLIICMCWMSKLWLFVIVIRF